MSRLPIALLTLALATPAAAAPDSTGARISLVIPEVCEISAGTVVLSPGTAETTTTIGELCNTNDFYQIAAMHRPLGPDEGGRISFRNASHSMDASGTTLLGGRSGPSASTTPVRFDELQLAAPMAVSFVVTTF